MKFPGTNNQNNTKVKMAQKGFFPGRRADGTQMKSQPFPIAKHIGVHIPPAQNRTWAQLRCLHSSFLALVLVQVLKSRTTHSQQVYIATLIHSNSCQIYPLSHQ